MDTNTRIAAESLFGLKGREYQRDTVTGNAVQSLVNTTPHE